MDSVRQDISNYKIELSIILILTVVAIVTRFYNISNQVLWWDEFGTQYFSNLSFSEIGKTDNNSPTYYIIEGWILKIFGKTELAIKFLSAFFGALTVPLMFLITNKMFNSKEVSIFVAVVTLLSPVMIFYSQEARGFSFGLFLFLVSFLAFLFILSNDNWGSWLIFAIFGAFSIHIQYVFAIPLAIIILFLAIQRIILLCKATNRTDRINIMKKLVVSSVLFMILMYPIIEAFLWSYNTSVSLVGTWSTGWDLIRDTMLDFLFQEKIVEITLIVAIIIGSIVILKKKTESAVIILALCIIPVVFLYDLSFQTHVHQRYMFYIVPFLYLLAGSSLLIFEKKNKLKIASVVVCSLVLFAFTAPTLSDYYNDDQTTGSFKEAVGIIEDNIEDGDCIIYCPKWLYWGFEGGLSFYYDSENKNTPIYKIDSAEELISGVKYLPYNHIYLMLYTLDDVYEWVKDYPQAQLLFCGCIYLYKVTCDHYYS